MTRLVTNRYFNNYLFQRWRLLVETYRFFHPLRYLTKISL
ncbi:hypothetical protein BN1088_1432821 [Sphingobacterium sp. PM2-P1-29]|nr:hypothetical protein BN1088_1432821 [Sphingobacterium sp. PM2-P1-29]